MKKCARDRFNDPARLRGAKADNHWSIKPAIKSGMDLAPNPKLSPRFGESNLEQSVSSFDVLRHREEGDERQIEPNGRVHSQTRH
jgi:hypothetical protein